MTMGDDEFFGSTAARNPLTLDELVSFGIQLLNIAFTLYWPDRRYCKKTTKCLLDIQVHAREYVPFQACSHPLRGRTLT
jgi:hypothetical protein